jgi:Lrp/AsnC family transcriptional regulator for asnA, asnC and gidA
LTYDIDEVDKKILTMLQQDARTPFSKIAKSLNLSEATIHIRIKRLRNEGVLRGFYADVDPERAGRGVLGFVLVKAEPRKYDEILKNIVSMKEVTDVYDVTGEYYALAKVRVGTREELAKVLDNIGNIDGVISTYTMFVLRIVKETKILEF